MSCHKGRSGKCAFIGLFTRLPDLTEFALFGYSHIPVDEFYGMFDIIKLNS